MQRVLCLRQSLLRWRSRSRQVALITCVDCGGPVSSLAEACPRCGRPSRTASKWNPADSGNLETAVNDRNDVVSRLARLWFSPRGRTTRLSYLGNFLLPLAVLGFVASRVDVLLEGPTQESVIRELIDDGLSDEQIAVRLGNDPNFRALETEAPSGMGPFALVATLLSFGIGGMGAIKRFHDFNVTGWMFGGFAILLTTSVFLPILDVAMGEVGLMPTASFLLFRVLPPVLVVYLLALLVVPGTRGPNKYGPSPIS
jgi:uncharacterized membrane protein YhaH (DUF805 family)